MPDELITTPPPAPAGEQPSSPPTPLDERAAVYQRYNELYGSPTATPAAPKPAEPAPTPTEPAPTPAPVVPAPVIPPASDPAALAARMERLIEERVQAAIASFQPQPTSTAPPAPVEPEDWVALLASGQRDRAEAILGEKLTAPAVERAITQALELSRVEREIETYLTEFRGSNTHLLPLEDLIATKVQRSLAADQASGLVKSPADFVGRYKAAVTKAANEARTIYQQIRAAAKEEANVVKREVISSSTLPPTAIETSRGVTAPETPKLDSFESYLAARQADTQRKRGFVS